MKRNAARREKIRIQTERLAIAGSRVRKNKKRGRARYPYRTITEMIMEREHQALDVNRSHGPVYVCVYVLASVYHLGVGCTASINHRTSLDKLR